MRQPPPAGGLASRRGGLVGQGAFPEPAWSPIETGAIGTTAEHGDQGAPADVLGTLQRMTKDDLKRAVIFREVLGPPISARPGPLAEWSAP